MANLWQRIFNTATEDRAVQPTIPARAAAIVTPDTALSLTSVYRAVQVLATPISKMPINTYRFATGIELKVENPVLVNRPSLTQTRRDFIFQTVASLALEGNAFWFKGYGSNDQVNELTLIPASAVGVRYRNNEDITKGFVYEYQNKDYTSREIEHLRLFTKPGVLRGISPIQACYPDVSSAIDLRDYAKNWFTSGGVPTGVLTTNAMLSAAEAEAITTNWHNKQQQRQVAVLGNGFDYKQVALSPRDALFVEIQEQATQTIARMFGIPARLLLTTVPGSTDTYTNLQDENQVFYRHTLMAYIDAITDGLSNCLPRGTRVEFDYMHLFRADTKTRFETYAIAIDKGIMTVEEVRSREGLVE